MSITTEIETLKTNLTNAYTSISTKGGTIPTNKNAQNLATAINSIVTVREETQEKDINFYDYEGTRLYSWTLAELASKTELPELPTHDGLTCQGWNWSLVDLKNENAKMNVGAMYITNDGKTRIYVHLIKGYLSPYLGFSQSVANGVEVDWGDGSPVETSSVEDSTTPVNMQHTYASEGSYIITLNPLNNCTIYIKGNSSSSQLLWAKDYTNSYLDIPYTCSIKKIELGRAVIINNYAFAACKHLKSITMPNYISDIGQYTFWQTHNYNYITIPNAVTAIPFCTFYYCYGLKTISIPKSVTQISGGYSFYNANTLTNITLPSSIMSIAQYSFGRTETLGIISIPKEVPTIYQKTFEYATNLAYIDFSKHTSVPSLDSSTAFDNAAAFLKIVVPDSLYNTWIAATNWSSYASKIIKASEWTT